MNASYDKKPARSGSRGLFNVSKLLFGRRRAQVLAPARLSSTYSLITEHEYDER